MSLRAGLLAALALAALATPAEAQLGRGARRSPDAWDLQWNARYGMSFGGRSEALGRGFEFDNTLRFDVLFGRPGNEHWRIGPAIDLRTTFRDSAEAAGGASLLIPIVRAYPLLLTVAGGWAVRRDPRPDGPVLVTTLAGGFRSYNFHGRYQIASHAFVTSRVHLDATERWELSVGFSLDLEALLVLPMGAIVTRAGASDPDEPLENE
ncbi:MAG: hypothetical protein AAGH15_08430 [Myxococcota bacterium]